MEQGKTEAARDAAALVAAITGTLATLDDRVYSPRVAIEYDPLSSISAPSGGGGGRRKGGGRNRGGGLTPDDSFFGSTANVGRAGGSSTTHFSINGGTFLGDPASASQWARAAAPAMAREMRRLGVQ
jgi:hypothetical protein